MSSTNRPSFFTAALELVGKEIDIITNNEGARLSGTVTNAMFDSLLLRTESGPKVIAFADICSLTPRASEASEAIRP